jgi:hypothetical protein
MAEFSKQWCEKHQPDWTGDFDIFEESSELPNEHYVNIMCEGFGFLAIGKNENGEAIFAIPEDNSEYVKWISYEQLMA